LLRDRDHIYGHDFVEQVEAMGIKQVLSVPRSPWQRAYIERLIGTIRRECLDHLIVFDERSLCHHLRAFCDYYHRSRTHLALDTDSPETRAIQRPEAGRIISIPEVGDSTIATNAAQPDREACLHAGLLGIQPRWLATAMDRRAAAHAKRRRRPLTYVS
jgi:hypothetical protein